MTNNVIRLAFSSPQMDLSEHWISCTECQNKTYTLIQRGAELFPRLQCAACGNHIGCMGWAPAYEGEDRETP